MPILNNKKKSMSRPGTNEYDEVMRRRKQNEEKYATLEEKANVAKMRLKVSLNDCINDIN